MATLTRDEAAKRFEELPLPTTADEHWRFTDLRGFAPNGHVPSPDTGTGPGTRRCSTSTSPAGPSSPRTGSRSSPRPRASRSSRCRPTIRRRSIPDDDKFAVENLARWQHGLLVHVPKGVELEKPLYVQVTSNGGSLYWRMVVRADEGARFTLIEDLSSAAPDTVAYTNAVVELFVEPAAKIEYVSLQNLSKETWHFGRHRARLERDSELDWVLGGFGSKRGKVWIENDLVGPGATSRVTGAYFADGEQHLDYDTFQEHAAPNTESDFAFKGALREKASAVWRGMIRVEENAQKTNAYQENRNLLLSERGARRLDPRARDHGQRRALHPRRDARPDQPRGALLPDGARALARRGRAADRARLLPGRARPDRARAGARGARRRARSAHPAGVA